MISSTPISPSTSRASTPISRKSVSSNTFSESGSLKRKKGPDERDGAVFKLPVFSPDIKQCIRTDTFYTSAQRNRLIKEACLHLRGFCWEREIEISSVEKKSLGSYTVIHFIFIVESPTLLMSCSFLTKNKLNDGSVGREFRSVLLTYHLSPSFLSLLSNPFFLSLLSLPFPFSPIPPNPSGFYTRIFHLMHTRIGQLYYA